MAIADLESSGVFADIAGHTQVQLALSSVAAETATLAEGLYDVYCDVTCYVQVSNLSTTVTTNNGYPLFGGILVTLYVPEGYRISGILASGTGTLKIHKTGDIAP